MKDEAIGQEDRNRINRLLEKSWTPKVFRHTTATEYSPILSAPDGWTENSNTSSYYRHYNGDEASKSLMEAFGIVPKQRALPKMKECPNVTCKELNTPDAPFCVKCRVPLTVAPHIEEGHRKDQEMQELKQQMAQSRQEIKDQFQAYEAKMNEFVHDIQSSLNQEEVSRPYRNFRLKKMTEILDREVPGWFDEVYGPGASAHKLTPKGQERVRQLLK